MKFITILVVAFAICVCTTWAVPQDMIPLKALKGLAEGEVPNYETFEAFEPLLGAQLSAEEEPAKAPEQSGVSLIDAQSGVAVDAEARAAAAQELQFARIQYLQAAIADKRSELRKQRESLDQEVEQFNKEKQLIAYNRRIIASNEEQVNAAQRELANLLESYSQNVKSGLINFKSDSPSKNMNKNKKKASAPEVFMEIHSTAEADAEAEADFDMHHEADASDADEALRTMMSLSQEELY